MTADRRISSINHLAHRIERKHAAIVVGENGQISGARLRLAATIPLSTPAEAFREARKVADNKIEGPRK
jgi:hypothetical protein